MTNEKIVQLSINTIRTLSMATPEQTRAMLKIGVTYKTTEETLANLGLPPNRPDGNAGFHVHVTDGKLPKARPGSSDGHMIAGEE